MREVENFYNFSLFINWYVIFDALEFTLIARLNVEKGGGGIIKMHAILSKFSFALNSKGKEYIAPTLLFMLSLHHHAV